AERGQQQVVRVGSGIAAAVGDRLVGDEGMLAGPYFLGERRPAAANDHHAHLPARKALACASPGRRLSEAEATAASVAEYIRALSRSPASSAARATPWSVLNRFGARLSEASYSRTACAGWFISSSMSPSSSRAVAMGPGVMLCFSVESSSSAAPRMRASAS